MSSILELPAATIGSCSRCNGLAETTSQRDSLTERSPGARRSERTSERPRLLCLYCGTQLTLRPEEGVACAGCGRHFPIVRNVARFVERSDYAGSFGFQWARFARVQLDSASGTTRSLDTFTTKTGWSTAELAGELVLDAGCGMGGFTDICGNAGAEVHAVDMSEAVEGAADDLRG